MCNLWICLSPSLPLSLDFFHPGYIGDHSAPLLNKLPLPWQLYNMPWDDVDDVQIGPMKPPGQKREVQSGNTHLFISSSTPLTAARQKHTSHKPQVRHVALYTSGLIQGQIPKPYVHFFHHPGQNTRHQPKKEEHLPTFLYILCAIL